MAARPPRDPGAPKLSAKERLIAFMVVYDPSGLGRVDDLLREFKGRERDLFRALGRKFGLTTAQALSVGA